MKFFHGFLGRPKLESPGDVESWVMAPFVCQTNWQNSGEKNKTHWKHQQKFLFKTLSGFIPRMFWACFWLNRSRYHTVIVFSFWWWRLHHDSLKSIENLCSKFRCGFTTTNRDIKNAIRQGLLEVKYGSWTSREHIGNINKSYCSKKLP